MLGETLPYYGLGKTPVDTAEPVPGPTTEYFGKLAKQHNLYIVLSVFEREQAPGLQHGRRCSGRTGSSWASIARSVCRAARSPPASLLVTTIRCSIRGSASSG